MLLLLAVGAGAWAVGGDRARASARRLFLVNGGWDPLEVSVDGEPPLELRPGSVASMALAEGTHRARVEPHGAELSFALEGSFFERLADRTAFVLDPSGAALLAFESEEYGPGQPQGHAPPPRLLFGEAFRRVSGVDHPFEDFPAQVSGHGETVVRTRLRLVPGPPGRALAAFPPRDPAALDYAERLLDPRREDEELLEAYLRRARALGQLSAALAVLRGKLEPVAAAPEGRLNVVWHRALHDLLRATGGDVAALRAAYRERLQASPQDAGLHYMLGRTATDPSEKRACYERAVALDPECSWAHFALAVHAARRGEYERARPHARKAAALRPHDEAMREFAFRVRFALGEYAALEAEARARRTTAPLDLLTLRRHLEALVALGRVAEAREAVQTYRQEVRARSTGDPAQLALHAELLLDDLLGEHARRAERAAALRSERQRSWILFQTLLERGELAAAEKLLPSVGEPAAVVFLALARRRAGAGPEALAADRARCAQALPQAAACFERPDLGALLALPLPDTTKAALLALLDPGDPAFAEARRRLARTTRYFPYRLLEGEG
ncbi:MAG: hypothetical protein D6731_18515 [Planctomycetota bacterium]|nr:MAG: hypothetical protein D6731_18515 [Planctomycetota bacterium]